MGKNKHGLCRRCGQERALEANGAHCRACGRADRAEKQKTIPKPQAPEPDLRVVWPPEQESWGRCPKCETGVQLLVDGMTINHKSGKSETWDGIGRRCTGSGWSGGFSCVIGNPPWERVKIQDKEFFSNLGRTDIANAATAALRKKMIDGLKNDEPSLHSAYRNALRQSDATANFLLKSNRFPLSGQGDVNTYSVFAETARTIVSPNGVAGILTPSGLATDKTTAPFFSDTLSSRRLYAFYDFENEAKVFADVHNQMRFAITVMLGAARRISQSRFAFYTRYVADLPSRRFEMAPSEVLKINPNTGTLPMFRTRADADITLKIYDRHPVLRRGGDPNGNPWGLSFGTLLHMSNDSSLFQQSKDLSSAQFNGWSFERNGVEYMPLYEAKMLGHFDHRFSTYRGATQKQLNKGTLPRPTEKEHDDPDVEPLARYWVDRAQVGAKLAGTWDRSWLLGWRDITNASNERTFVPSVLPRSAVGHVFPVVFISDPDLAPLLHALWSSLIFDYVARQKMSGTHMTYNIVEQLPCPLPEALNQSTPWQRTTSLAEWVSSHVLELSYTSWRLKPYAGDLGDDGPPFHWEPERRALLRADLDAGFLHIYGLDRLEAEHVLDSFTVVRKYEERDYGEYRTKRLVLEAYDRMTQAIANGGKGWEPLADPPAGLGPRHKAR